MVLAAPCLFAQAIELNSIGVQHNASLENKLQIEEQSFISNFQGEPNWRRPPQKIAGNLLSSEGNVTALVVLAENYQIKDSLDNNKYCQKPFAKSTFNGEIVVCQQSDMPAHVIAENLEQAGASGLIVQAMSLKKITSDNINSIPSISTDLDAYFLLKNWVNYSKPDTAIATIGE